MKKILALMLVLMMVTGCGKSPENVVETYLKKYKTLDSEVLVDLEDVIDKENLSKNQEEKYRDILKKQYKDLAYKILEEEYDDEVSYVTVQIEVYDLYKVQNDAHLYLENNRSLFLDEDGEYDSDKFMDYKLDKMKDTTDRIEYTITFTVMKEDGEYVVSQPTPDDLLKIHGIYNYDLN